MIYVNVNTRKLCITPLDEISKQSKNIDSAWSIVRQKAFCFIVASVYLKLNYKDAVKDLLAMLESAKNLSTEINANGVIAFGDYNARNRCGPLTAINTVLSSSNRKRRLRFAIVKLLSWLVLAARVLLLVKGTW